jgi:E3 ubiquitin-protein ligase NEDD4
MIRPLYKHLLGWPITFEDLEVVDDALYNSLKDLICKADCVGDMGFNFTATEDLLGSMTEIPLIKNGENIDVTPDNLPEFIECRLKYAMVGRVKPQLTELLLGFFDLMEEPLLTVFDFQELELLMCGLPEIDTTDWQENTDYTGEFAVLGRMHPVCNWFWQVVEEFDQEHKAKLLQFVTGKYSLFIFTF